MNGQTIVDTDLSTIEKTADGRGVKGYPGMRRTEGHIAFLGHGSRVAFRNIRIKVLEQSPAHAGSPSVFCWRRAHFSGMSMAEKRVPTEVGTPTVAPDRAWNTCSAREIVFVGRLRGSAFSIAVATPARR